MKIFPSLEALETEIDVCGSHLYPQTSLVAHHASQGQHHETDYFSRRAYSSLVCRMTVFLCTGICCPLGIGYSCLRRASSFRFSRSFIVLSCLRYACADSSPFGPCIISPVSAQYVRVERI